MRLPSIKTLSEVFEEPETARKILEMSREQLERHPAGAARVAECYNPPATEDIRMRVLNSLESGFHGVEFLESRDQDFADYLNVGEIYAATLILWRGNYRVQCVGDFVERVREFKEPHTDY